VTVAMYSFAIARYAASAAVAGVAFVLVVVVPPPPPHAAASRATNGTNDRIPNPESRTPVLRRM